jgi:hypothetical protein
MRRLAFIGGGCIVLVLVLSSDRVGVIDVFDEEETESVAAVAPADATTTTVVPPAAQEAVLFDDTGESDDAEELWGSVDCDLDDTPPEESGIFQVDSDGDPSPRADGSDQGNDAFRLARVHDGDDFFGERCELGHNDSAEGPTALYRDGDRLITYASFRLPPSFPVDTRDWQGVLQLKQTQPADNADGTPVLSLGAYRGRWILFHSGPGYTEVDQELWSVPAQAGVWARFAIDTKLSADPTKGSVRVRADLDGDGTFETTSPRFKTNTLKLETEGDSGDGFEAGDTLPSHLRIGLYHNPVIPCANGCHLDMDNVQVVRP